MLAEARAAHRDLRYCPDCGRVTEAVIIDHRRLDVMCTECERLLADPFLAIELAAATIAAASAPRKKRRKEASSEGAASVPRVRVDVGLRLGLAPGIDKEHVEGFGAISDMADRRGHGLRPATDRAQLEGFDAISDMADRLGLAASVRDRAKEVFKNMEEAKAWPPGTGWDRDRSRGTLYAACISIACRNAGSPRALKELASVTAGGAMARKEIAKLTAYIRRRLGEEEAGQATGIGVVRPSSYLRHFGPLLGMRDQEAAAAREAARRLEESDLDLRHTPESVAAGIIFMATERAGAKKPVNVKDVSAATGVAKSTINAVNKKLRPHAEMLFG